ncbi:homologous recombination OB-fold protein isoform X2 [Microcaecilia unicolor]|uniref:Uncharacterized protein C17orf53 homolog isoform X2 n=1 Tax=Microcaecilia unicolor TaxID=1415580 RepID=A0A6P7ZE50_9AMPH|nr:uncharacterized protein C17orf53 homolog isoform X2 [Microcaecilia unicolor]
MGEAGEARTGGERTEAWSLQKLFAVEEEFEDEDFLSAVKDVETTSGPGLSVNKYLRPIASSLQAPDRILSTPHRPLDDSINKLSPVLGLQNPSKSSVGTSLLRRSTHCLRPMSNPVLNFTDTEESWTLKCTVSASSSKNCISHAGDQQPPCSSNAKFTSKSAPLAYLGKVVDLESEDALFLSACTEVGPEPGRVEHENAHRLQESASQVRIRDDGANDSIVTKKLCVAGQMAPFRLRTSGIVQRQDTQLAQMSTHNISEIPSLSTSLNLRPSTVGGCQHSLPFTSRATVPVTSTLTPTNTTLVRTVGMVYQAAKPIHSSSHQPGTGLSSSNSHRGLVPFPSSIRSPQPFLAAGRTSRLPAPQMPTQISPRLPSNSFQQPHTLKPHTEPPTAILRTPCSIAGPGTLQSPVLTNHLVQLVTAANKTPQTDSWDLLQAKTRRFPGPAGILPQQHGGKNLEEILISTPHKPTHGALAKFHSEEASSSPLLADESFGRGPWSTMKAELGLDENDPCCFLRTYSVVMVLRKAVLKQLPKNKVPQMAVMLKSLTHATVDASAVFKDPTGEIQGTVHHMLLEERENDLKAGAVLLLQQVGVFSPSLRNHYLNVTPNNLVKVYLPDSDSSIQVPQKRETSP